MKDTNLEEKVILFLDAMQHIEVGLMHCILCLTDEPVNKHRQWLHRQISTDKAQTQTILRGERPIGLYSLRQVTEVKLGRVRSDFGWVTSED